VLAALATSAVSSLAGAQVAEERANPIEIRAGIEVFPHQGISGMRDYSMEEHSQAYGVAASALLNAVGPLWAGLGVSYARTGRDDTGYSPEGPVTGWLLHVPVLVELGFPIRKPESRVLVGLEGGALFGGFDNVYHSYTDDGEVRVRGPFVGLRGGYALSYVEDIAIAATIGARGGSVDQTNAQRSSYSNDGMVYVSLSVVLALHFRP
jgi:hypothetical protein